MQKIGIIGGGQLGRMLVEAAKNLGFYTVVLDPTPNGPAAQVADKEIIGDFKDASKIKEVADQVDFVTFEIESANADALNDLVGEGKDINPHPKILETIKDKYLQKKFLEKNGIPVADSVEVSDEEEIKKAGTVFGYPFLLKARKDAYDGRGNALIKNEIDIKDGIVKLKDRTLYVEKFVPFVKELAVVVGRSKNGEVKVFPAVETIHKNNICHIVISPAPVKKDITQKAEELATKIIADFKGVGVFAVEMFLTEKNELVINEIAPRVHNSGHHTIEGNKTSQFEQHIRAITGMPLGDTGHTAPFSVMINILGERSGEVKLEGEEKLNEIKGATMHIYGKSETRPERKMGHITVVGDDLIEVLEKARLARSIISI
ncbi:MAG: N5-carboxyaminoimidazole ribonucleotide synthase [Candidatus Taylorbacteria bacterium]|nr:N5-carboxyaminoimidazole ribonucleotide synthase [Candidatus Taylorbacteria bacterium]